MYIVEEQEEEETHGEGKEEEKMEDRAEDACRAVRRVRSHRGRLISIKARCSGSGSWQKYNTDSLPPLQVRI